MWKRWVLVVILLVACASPLYGHKNPIIEYAYVGHIWQESYTTIPRQPVVDEQIIFKLGVEHPNGIIEHNVTGLISIYRDDTEYTWQGGKPYKVPDWMLVKEAPLQPEGGNKFTEYVVISEPGSYLVTVDWYESEQYIGQSMHVLDIETRTVGPLFLAFSVLVVLGVLFGVWSGVL